MLFIFDWDGTLAGEKSELSNDSKLAINKLNKLGYKVVVATGRHPKEIADKIIGNSNIENYLIGGNGSIIWDRENDASILSQSIPSKYFNEFLKDIYEFKSIIVYIKIVRDKGISRYRKTREFFYPNEEQKLIISRPTATIGIEFLENSKWRKVLNYWIEKYKKKLSISICADNFININKLKVNKWEAIKWVSRKINMHDRKIITFGDSLNDKEMLVGSHLGIAMGNATQELLEISDHTIGHSKESGILKFVEKIEANPNILLSKFKN